MIDYLSFRFALVLILAATLLTAAACWRMQFGQSSTYKNPRR
jgi:hypothetical protein